MASTSHNCMYVSCTNNNRKAKDISFFKFPVKDANRAQKWQENCGNINIAHLDVSELNNYMVCEEHFSSNYVRINGRRKLLTKSAVPIKFIGIKEEDQAQTQWEGEFSCTTFAEAQYLSVGDCSKVYSNKRLHPDSHPLTNINIHIDSPPSAEINSTSAPEVSSNCSFKIEYATQYLLNKKIAALTEKQVELKKKLNAIRHQNYRLVQKKKSFSLTKEIDKLMTDKSRFVKTLVGMQLYHRRASKWTKREQNLALTLYQKSPSAYRFMLCNLKLVLPCLRVVRHWRRINRTLVNQVSNSQQLPVQSSDNNGQ